MAAKVPTQVVGIIRISAGSRPTQLVGRQELNRLNDARFAWRCQSSRSWTIADSRKLRHELAELLDATTH